MSRYFINHPTVAIVIAIVMVLVGLVSMTGLPLTQYPKIIPPEILTQATYPGADALTIEQSVSAPIEQQMSGVDNMNYMYSVSSNTGYMRLTVNFDVKTDPNTDHILSQLRAGLAQPQLPVDVRNLGVSVQKSYSTPLILLAFYSPQGTHDATFLANYSYIHLNDPLTRVKGIGQVVVFGAGQYAVRCWVRPDLLSKLGITVAEIIDALQKQNTVNPAGQIGGEPSPPGQQFTYAIRVQGRLETPEQFADIVLRANPDGSQVRLGDVARIELGAQDYNIKGRFGGKPSAILALYQLPGANALQAVEGVKKTMARLKESFPADLDYAVALDTTRSVAEGLKEIIKTLLIALFLVIVVVMIFLQGWRATLIPIIAVPVSLIGTFTFFPLLGFSINPIVLMGMVVAIGLVVDDAIIVVESVSRHMDEGMPAKEAAHKTMEEVSGPVIAIALVLASVFLPTVFIPGITGRLFQQFAVTIAISVLLSAFNALTLSPAMCAILLRPKKPTTGPGPLGMFFSIFNQSFKRTSDGYVNLSSAIIKKKTLGFAILAIMSFGVLFLGARLPGGFLPEEDQGYVQASIQLPNAASLQRTEAACAEVEKIIMGVPGVEGCTTVCGFSLLNQVRTSYSGQFFIKLKPWSKRKPSGQKARAIISRLNREFSRIPQGFLLAYSPPAIQGVGASGGVTFVLEDRAGNPPSFLSENTLKFVAEAKKRPEFARVSSTLLPFVPQYFVNVDRSKALTEGVDLSQIYSTLQVFMGGGFVNYFNRFGRQWQVYVEAESAFRSDTSQLGLFFVRNKAGNPVPLSALTSVELRHGPEFIMRYNLFRCSQINVLASPGYSSAQASKALEEVFKKNMPVDMGFDYLGMSYQEQLAKQGVPPAAVFGLSLLFVFLVLTALYESWSMPLSVLASTPIAICGAFAALLALSMEFNTYAQIGLIVLLGLAAKNSILIVEFARNEYKKGQDATQAALTGARLRFRPILMTSFAFIFGCIPLALASGSGAIARQVMGIGVIGGMLAATCIAVLIIPMLYYVVETFLRKDRKK